MTTQTLNQTYIPNLPRILLLAPESTLHNENIMSSPAPLIYINAFPGTGKLTIARALLPLLPTTNTPPILLDSHTLIDPVAARYPRTHPSYQAARKAERRRVCGMYVESAEYRDSVVVVTESRSTSPHEVRITREFVDAAARGGRRFIPVVLMCDVDENMRRVGSEERRRSGTTKIVCPERVREIRAECEIYQFGVEEELVLDVTHVEPGEAAARIVEWMGRVMSRDIGRVPDGDGVE